MFGAREGPEGDGGADGEGGAVIKGMVEGCWAEADVSRKLKIKLSKIRPKTSSRIDYLYRFSKKGFIPPAGDLIPANQAYRPDVSHQAL
jgi:hypothetical protein